MPEIVLTSKRSSLKGEPYDRSLYCSRIYRIWSNMKTRCNNKKVSCYSRYGGRGITYSKEWETFSGFLKDMLPTYQDNLTIERIDNSKGYFKENCRWATPKEQAKNTRNVERAARFTYQGKTLTISEWTQVVGIKRKTIGMRLLDYGWSVERALTVRPTHELARN